MTGFANLVVLDLECADPPALAEFYHQILGWDVILSQTEYSEISNGSTRILFTGRDGYEGPGWPESRAPNADFRVAGSGQPVRARISPVCR